MSRQHYAPVAEQLLLIERELRSLKLWSEQAPSAEALASPHPFCVDTLEFEAWLQWLLLPRMKELIEAGAPLPSGSGIRAMGEVSFAQRNIQARSLLLELDRFDRLLSKS